MPFFSDWKKKKIVVSNYFYPLALIRRNSALKWRPILEHWLLSLKLKWIIINWRTDRFNGEAAVTWVQSGDSTIVWIFIIFPHSAKFSHQSVRVNYFLSCLTLCDWYARLTWLLIKVVSKAITTFDILGMLCLLSSVIHNIPPQSSHTQDCSLQKHSLDCVAYTCHHPWGLYSWQLLINQ